MSTEVDLRLRRTARVGTRHPAISFLVLAGLPGALALLVAIAGPWVAPHGAGESIGTPYQSHLGGATLGTDYLGRDVLSRVLDGGRSIILLSALAAAVGSALGALVGIAAGYVGGRLDAASTRLIDTVLALPRLLVLLIVVSALGSGRWIIVSVVVLTGAPFAARLARSATLGVLRSGFVEAALVTGEGTSSVIVRDLLPNVSGPLLANAGLSFVHSIYLVASASFLGFAPQGAAPDWAVMVNENIEGVTLSPWAVVGPAVLIASLAVSANLLADGLSRRLAR